LPLVSWARAKACDPGPMQRLIMRKVREVLRLRHLGLSQRQIAIAVSIAPSTVVDYLRRAGDAELAWERAEQQSDAELEAAMFRTRRRVEAVERVTLDFPRVHRELSRTGVTLHLLWEEYRDAALSRHDPRPPYRYSQFCRLYGAWRGLLKPTMRQVHRAGEKAFIDYSGKRPCIMESGVEREVELFVMVLGASNYTFAEATFSQKLSDFTASTVRGLEYFGAVPELLVPDQLKSAVRVADRYDPVVNDTYYELGRHYNLTVIPARPGKPRDKAKVEVAVLIAQRWILARLRNQKFFSLGELNEAIAALLDDLNHRPFKKLEGCRRSAFESIDLPAMRPLPSTRFEYLDRAKARVNIDYHVEFEGRLYSVPHRLIHERVDLRASASVVEIFHNGDRVASHPRCYARKGTPVTCQEHRPIQHQHQKWPPERLIAWANNFGPAVVCVVERTIASHRHPEYAYRACLGILRVAEKHGASRTEAACAFALAASKGAAPHRRHIEAILKKGLDQKASTQGAAHPLPTDHENVRGGDYYDRKENIH